MSSITATVDTASCRCKQQSTTSLFTAKAGRKESTHLSSVELRLVLLGKAGSGKSSTGNSILGRVAFGPRTSSSSATQRCRRACGEFRGRYLMLLDTPGLLDTHQTPKEVQRELKRSVTLVFPGPHAFLLVVHIGRFTKDEEDALCQIQQALGPQVLSFSVVVFTYGDTVEEETKVRDCLIKGNEALAGLVARCGGRYCLFNNNTSKIKEQVSDLLALVNTMMEANGGSCYTSVMLMEMEDETERLVKEEMGPGREKQELMKWEQEEAVRRRYQVELQRVQIKCNMEIEAMKRTHGSEREKTEKLLREKEELLRRERADNEKTEKDRKIHEMVQVMAIRREEEKKRVALQEKLNRVAKTLEEVTDREKTSRRDTEMMTRVERAENQRKEGERELQLLLWEQTIRRREEKKREALQKELDGLKLVLEEQGRREQGEEEGEKTREEPLKSEREDSQMERERGLENQRVGKKGNGAMRTEEYKANKERVKLERDGRKLARNDRCDPEMSKGRNQSHKMRPESCCKDLVKKPPEVHSGLIRRVRPVSGYAQEMGLVVLNAALETIGAPCCIQ